MRDGGRTLLFIEVLVPRGSLTVAERSELAGRLTSRRLLAVAEATAADPGVTDLFESLTQVVVREVEIWLSQGPSCVANVLVGVWGKEMSEHLITRIGRELPEDAVVNVIGVPEGGYGMRGRAVRTPDMLEVIEAAKTGTDEAPDGMIVDPVCGAIIPLAEAVRWEHDGQTYGFCCPHCRGHFAKQVR